MDYAEACEQATTAQGLDPMVERLTAEGIDHFVDQTGGFCMVVTVPLDGGAQIGITLSETERALNESPRWLVVYYAEADAMSDPDLGQEIDGDDVTTAEAIALIRARSARV